MIFWLALALLSALFAALTSVFAKVGIRDVDSNLATAVRTMVVLAMAWIMVAVVGSWGGIWSISGNTLLFLTLSGLATGASWLCFYGALQQGPASVVVPVDKLSILFTVLLATVFLHERMSKKSWAGLILLVSGTLLLLV